VMRSFDPTPKSGQFANLFFASTGTYDPSADLLMPFGADAEPILFWKTVDKPARVPTFDEVKDKVEEAWRFREARVRAKKKAEEIEKAAHAAKGEALKILEGEAFKHPTWGSILTLENVARLIPKLGVAFDFTKQYEPYKVREEDIPYPRPNLVDRLTSLREPGDAVVVTDRPEKTYYVAVLLNRPQPSEDEFYKLYAKTPFQDSLLSRLEEERRLKYRQEILKQLRVEAGSKVSDRGNYVLDVDDETRRSLDLRGGEFGE